MSHFAKYIFLVIYVFSSFYSFGQSGETKKPSSLIVHGDDFIFGINEPVGWIGDIENASEFHSNIIFYKSKNDLDNGGVLIQVYNFSKQDEHTEEDLKFDIQSYREKYPDLKVEELKVEHKEYKCYSKTMYIENEFYVYTVYVNPGEKYKSGFSVAMNTTNRPATDYELIAFREIIASLIMLNG